MTELRSIVKYLYCIHFPELNKADCLKSFATAMQSAVFGHGPEDRGTSSTITVELRSFVKDSSSSMEQVRTDNRRVGLGEGGSATINTDVMLRVEDKANAAPCDGAHR